jgi:sortase A
MVIGDVSAPPEGTDASAGPSADTGEPGGASREAEVSDSAQEQKVRSVGPPRPSKLVILLSLVLFASIVAAFLGVFAYGLSGVQEHRSQQQLYSQFRELLAPASTVAPSIGGVINIGTPVALVNAPAAGIHNVVVIEGTSSGDLLNGPGHLPNTPLPGQGGEAVLVGKSTTAGAPFAHLALLRKGDMITVRTGQGEFLFTVRGQILPGIHQPAIPANRGRLVLVTSAGPGGVGGLEPSQTFDVEATLKGKAVVAPAHRPQTVAQSNLPGQTDPAAWPFVALWLAGLALASAAVWWLWSRWGLLRAWIVGAPVLLALLWGLSNEAMRLLPNVY